MSTFPIAHADELGWLTEVQMIEVDRVMIDDLGIALMQMMENAGRNLADFTIRRFGPSTATVFAGSGGNGGGGLVAARHLANRGVEVNVVLSKQRDGLDAVPGHQLAILDRMGVSVVDVGAGAEPTCVHRGLTPSVTQVGHVMIDALIGYSLKGAPRGRAAELIAEINLTRDESRPGQGGATQPDEVRVVSLDTPSGVVVDDGSTPGEAVRADATLTLALPKVGLRHAEQVGELYLADISVPPSVYAGMNIAMNRKAKGEAGPAPDFSTGTILRVE